MESKSNKEIFSEVYSKKIWGQTDKGGGYKEPFFSGSGSHDETIIVPYINLLLQIITNNNIRLITDLGCGDFWIMRNVLSALSKNNYAFFYNGVDVVEDLIKHNSETFNYPHIKFHCMDAAQDDTELPFGELLIIRQVLQHLSNSDIKKILSKIKAFKFVLITEHIYEGIDKIINIDKSTDGNIRIGLRSGVYVEKPPYNLKNIVHLLRVEEGGGIIRSSLIINEI